MFPFSLARECRNSTLASGALVFFEWRAWIKAIDSVRAYSRS